MEPKTVLLVEDNASDEELTVRALNKSAVPCTLVVVRDGEEALNRLFGNETAALPDLILLDLKLPKVNGLDVLARVRAAGRTKMLPVIVLSSSAKDEDVATAYRSGCNGYLLKGVDYRAFVDAAQAAVRYWLVHNVAAKPSPAE